MCHIGFCWYGMFFYRFIFDFTVIDGNLWENLLTLTDISVY